MQISRNANDLDAIAVGQLQIAQQHVRPPGTHSRQHLGASADGNWHLDAWHRQQPLLEVVPGHGIVFEQINDGHGFIWHGGNALVQRSRDLWFN